MSITTKVKVAKFPFLNVKSYNKTIIGFKFGRQKDLSTLKDICGYFPCASFPRLETGKVVWVLSFDLLRIRINIAFRYSYVISVILHFLGKIK